jgi:hypothetical protein
MEVVLATTKDLWYAWRFWGADFLRSPKIQAMEESERVNILRELAGEIVSWFRSTPPLAPDAPEVDRWFPSKELLNKVDLEDQERVNE